MNSKRVDDVTMNSKYDDDVTKEPLKDITNTTSQNHHNVYDVIHIVNEGCFFKKFFDD